MRTNMFGGSDGADFVVFGPDAGEAETLWHATTGSRALRVGRSLFGFVVLRSDRKGQNPGSFGQGMRGGNLDGAYSRIDVER